MSENKKKHKVLPPNWAVASYGDIAEYLNGRVFKKADWEKNGLPIIRIQNLNSGDASFNYTSAEYENQYKVQNGDLLFSWSASLGVYIWNGGDAWLNQHIFNVKPYTGVEKRYLYYCLQNQISELYAQTHGAGMVHITKKKFEATSLPIPPNNEQVRIVAKIEQLFTELDKGIENLSVAREQLKVYRQSLLKQAFEGKLTEEWRKQHANQLETADQLLDRINLARDKRYQEQLEEWEKAVDKWGKAGKDEKKPRKPSIAKALPPISKDELSHLPDVPTKWRFSRLAEIAQIGSGMSVSKNRKLTDPIDVPYLRVANVQRGQLILDEMKTMQVEKDKLNELKLNEFDVLFNEGGDRDKLGRGWIWESQIEPCITQNHVFRATPYLKSEFHSKFISHWGNTFGQSYFDAGGKQTTNLASINKTVLSMFPVPIPSMEEQEKIIIEIDRVTTIMDSFENKIEIALSESEALRHSILKKAFSGKLVSQDPNDEPASELLARIETEREQVEKETKRLKVPRKKVVKKVKVMANLLEVLENTKDWLNAQDAFRQCGITDGSETDNIEKIYDELRTYVKDDRIEIERRGDEDWLRVSPGGVMCD